MHDRGAKKDPIITSDGLQELPVHGKEYFFSNVMVKLYQVPSMFISPSEFAPKKMESSFIVLIYEKKCVKRRPANKDKEYDDLKMKIQIKRSNQSRYLADKLLNREAKMRRFCNFFLVAFDYKKINPFIQFIK